MHWASFSRQYPNASRAFRAFRSIGTGPALAKKNPANVWALISSDARTNALIQSERSARVSDALPARLSPGPRKISGVRSVPAIPRRSLRTPLLRPTGMQASSIRKMAKARRQTLLDLLSQLLIFCRSARRLDEGRKDVLASYDLNCLDSLRAHCW
jgi:hypothetical protein